jgi:hypothetical protein
MGLVSAMYKESPGTALPTLTEELEINSSPTVCAKVTNKQKFTSVPPLRIHGTVLNRRDDFIFITCPIRDT